MWFESHFHFETPGAMTRDHNSVVEAAIETIV